MDAGHLDDDQFQLGMTKIFIKAPESVSIAAPELGGSAERKVTGRNAWGIRVVRV